MTGQISGHWHVLEEFSRRAVDHAEATAVLADGIEYSYAQLAQDVQRVGVNLVSPGQVVGVKWSHSYNSLVAMLAVWFSGACYCPLDTSFPFDRLDSMQGIAKCQTVLEADGLDLSLGSVIRQPLGPTRVADTPAYIMFTSGSSGAPKAVSVPHRAIYSAIDSFVKTFKISDSDTVLQYSSLNWDTSLEEILPALSVGSTLAIDRLAHTGSFSQFLSVVRQRNVTVLDLPTAVWHELVLYLREYDIALPDRVRTVLIGGEPVYRARVDDWVATQSDQIELWNTYGSTETVLVTHAVQIAGPAVPDGVMNGQTVPIGFKLPHVVEHLADDGQLLIGGPSLAEGYVGRQELTAQRFCRIYSDSSTRRFFRTGDRVRLHDSGALDHIGRVDSLIKVRGILANPAEVESHLLRCAYVSNAVVTSEKSLGRTILVAYLVRADGHSDEAILVGVRDFLAAKVPAHLVPTKFEFVDRIPMLPNGKIDRINLMNRGQE